VERGNAETVTTGPTEETYTVVMQIRRSPIAAVVALSLLGGCPRARSDDSAATAEQVKDALVHAWDGYKQFAWGHDQLLPLSGGARDWYGVSFYMTPVDAFDTMLLMGLTDQAAEAKALILDSLSFDKDVSVQVFEVTIRLLGGLLSAYQMDGDPKFLALATDLADRLLPAFKSATGMPYRFVHLRTGVTDGPVSNPAEIGTLMLEFGTLSKFTGKPVYYDTAKRAVVALYDRRSSIGLVGSRIDVRTGEWRSTSSHVSGGIDSYYEYLLKSWRLFGDEDFHRMWETSVAAVTQYLADTTATGLWYAHVDMDTGSRTATRFGALDAFLPAVLALGGDLDHAKRLMESCYRMWTTFGIEPEELDYSTMEVTEPAYPLRPEIIESAYHLYHFTGDQRYRDMGRTMFESLLEHARVKNGFAAFSSVVTMEHTDEMESFFLAETLKYAYLLFAPPATLDFDAVTFNTEAHPLRPTWR
jgi:mannosidase alpha-like ER degradation enhancer 2